MAEQVFVGTGNAVDAVEALVQGLGAAVGQLVAAGGAPLHVRRMEWLSDTPAAFHPARRVIDLARREVLGGARPPLTLARGPGRLTVRLTAEIPAPVVDDTVVWREYTRAQLLQQYSPRSQIPSMQAVFDRWARDGEAFRRRHPDALDIAWGPGSNHLLDLYLPDGVAAPPLWVFIHGGYWQAADKNQHAHFAAGMLKAGYAVAMPHYDFAPEATLVVLGAQMQQALRFLHAQADALGIDGNAIHVAGHSAGAHLAAWLVADQAGPPIRSALLLSGIYDCRPCALLPVGRVLGVPDEASARAVSPCFMPKQPGTRVAVALGALESAEFLRQSRELARGWAACAPLVVAPGRHHFNLLDELRDGGPVLDLARAAAGG